MEDSIQFRKDGSIRMVLQDKTYKLRRPTIGELRKLDELHDELVELDNAEGRSKDDVREAIVGWVQESIRALSDAEPFEMNDDLPAWVIHTNIGGRFLNHWRSLPLPSGG